MWKMIAIEMVGMLAVLYMVVGSISGFLYIPILVILLSIFIVVGGKYGLKGVGVSILVFIVNLIIFNAYYNFTCGPNSADVKVMKPMAKKISDYIVKNGIPKSLKDIPDLPYELEGCEKKQKNLEKCIFHTNNREYEVEIYILGDTSIEIYSEKTKTGLRYKLKKNSSSNQWLIDEQDIKYSSKNSGICNPLRQ